MKYKDYIKVVSVVVADKIAGGYYDDVIIGEYDLHDACEAVFDEAFVDDDVTGNASGSCTFDRDLAVRHVSDLIWDDDFLKALDEAEEDLGKLVAKGPEAVDVVARCLALYEAGDAIETAVDKRLALINARCQSSVCTLI